MAVGKSTSETTLTISVRRKIPIPAQSPTAPCPIAAVRQVQGYLAKKYAPNPVRRPKTPRCQFGQKYDAKRVRNIQAGAAR